MENSFDAWMEEIENSSNFGFDDDLFEGWKSFETKIPESSTTTNTTQLPSLSEISRIVKLEDFCGI
jgi:hypothetical protein